MYKISRTNKIDVNLYDERINRTGFIMYDRKKIAADLDYYNAHAETCYDLARMRMIYKSGNNCNWMKSDCIIRYLIEYEHCPENYFFRARTKGASLESKRVLIPLREKHYAEEFLEHYMEYKSWSTKCSKLKSILDYCTDPAGIAADGTKLFKLPYYASVQKNLRFNYKDFDIISQIPKSMANCICVDDGYFLAWGDFAQSDLRIAYNLFLRTPENDKIFNSCEDKYEAFARMIAHLNGEDFDLEKFKDQRQTYKKNTLAPVYGQTSAVLPEDNVFVQRMVGFLNKIKNYTNYRDRIKQYLDYHVPLMVSSYFGFVQQIYSGAGNNATTYEALNAPCQTGTSEIVISVVNHILDTAYNLGYTEDDISLYMTRHDEPIFKIKKSALDLMTVLQDHSTVMVDGWTPLRLDWDFGYRYKVPDEELQSKFKDLVANFDETIVLPDAEQVAPYEPLPKLFTLGISKQITPDCKTIITFYDNENNEVMYSLLETNDQDEVDVEIKRKIRDAANNLHAANLNNVVIFSNFLQGYDFYNDVNFTYQQVDSNQVLFSSRRLCALMTWRYCNKLSLEPNVEKPVFTTYDYWINEVKDSSLLIVSSDMGESNE